jgi:hypothetical protein
MNPGEPSRAGGMEGMKRMKRINRGGGDKGYNQIGVSKPW